MKKSHGGVGGVQKERCNTGNEDARLHGIK